MSQPKPTPLEAFGSRKPPETPARKERKRQRVRRRRATYVAPQDSDKENPFASEGTDKVVASPESPEEVDDSNDQRLSENVPPHFGKL